MIITWYFLGVVVSLAAVFIAYFKWTYQYWRRRNMPYLEPEIPYGNLKSAVNAESFPVSIKKIYDEMKSRSWRYGGMYFIATANLCILDLDIIKNILTKDFQYFVDRDTYYNEEGDPLSAHLAFLTGNRWKALRSKLTPTFTSGKMKMMFQSLVECESNLHRRMDEKVQNKEAIDIKDVLACFTTDVIGSCAFGLDCKAIEQEDSPFRMYGKKSVAVDTTRALKTTFAAAFPKLAKFLNVILTPKDVSHFFITMVKDTVNYRQQNNIKRNDFLQMLIEMNNSGSLTMNEIAAQSFVFFAGGFETSSSLMSFTLYELSKNQDIQEKLRDEVLSVLKHHDGKVSYDAIQDMKYMNQVLEESLRKYPPAALTNRRCLKDYKVPGEDFIIEKGVVVVIPIVGIHHDEDYYPEPDRFDPERFSEENKSARHHYTFLPFGEGPRICIGARFGLMQSKMGLASLLQKYKFTVNKKTKEPLQFERGKPLLSVVGDIWLSAERI